MKRTKRSAILCLCFLLCAFFAAPAFGENAVIGESAVIDESASPKDEEETVIDYSEQEISAIEQWLNNYPRRQFGYESAAQRCKLLKAV